MPHAALWVVQQVMIDSSIYLFHSFNAARGFVGGAAQRELKNLGLFVVSMPHAALWVVQQELPVELTTRYEVSMPHAALWVVQHQYGRCRSVYNDVSMPHAALWVVQREHTIAQKNLILLFQCRTRLCGWCSFVALSPCPPRRKKPFWKVSGNLRCLTENM